MQEIIRHLTVLVQWQGFVIKMLCMLLFGKSYSPKEGKCDKKDYKKLKVDPMPIFGEPPIRQIWDYKIMLEKYREKHGKAV